MEINLSPDQKSHIRHISVKMNLSEREIEVLEGALEGLKNLEIAENLCVSEKTIKFHLSNVFIKTGVKNRQQLFWILKLIWPISRNFQG